MEILYRKKNMLLFELCQKLRMILNENIELSLGVDIKVEGDNIYLTSTKSNEGLSICFHPNHLSSDISIYRSGVRYFYSRREIKMKRSTVGDLIESFKKDEKLNGCLNILKTYLAIVINQHLNINNERVS